MAQIPAQIRLPPTLLSLPRELRDEIWDLVLQGLEPFDVTISKRHHPSGKGDTGFFVSYPLPETPEADHVPRSPRELRWLLSNKQICEEGIEQLQRKAVWTLTKDGSISQAMDVVGGVPAVSRGGTRRFVDPLIMPSSARNLVVQVPVGILGHLELDRRENPFWMMEMKAAGSILRLFSQRPRSQQLLTLSITLYSPKCSSEVQHVPVRAKIFGMPPLDAASLRSMEFRMYDPHGRWPNLNYTPDIKDALDTLGMALIGGDGVKTHETIDVDSEPVEVLTYTRKKT